MKLVTSVLSLESEDEMDVSAQKRSVILLLPKQIVLLLPPIAPLGEPDLPELAPIHILLPPDETSSPAALPTAA